MKEVNGIASHSCMIWLLRRGRVSRSSSGVGSREQILPSMQDLANHGLAFDSRRSFYYLIAATESGT